MNRFIIAVTAAICATGVARAEVTQDDITNDQTNTSQIVTNGMGQQLQRFSPARHAEQGKRQEPDARLGPFRLAAKNSAGRKPSR